MLRSTAKNHQSTAIVTSPVDYAQVQACMEANHGGTTLALRKTLAAKAFALSASYDSAIATYFCKQHNAEKGRDETLPLPIVTRVYQPEFPLKYGCNPHQKPAMIASLLGSKLPFEVKNGVPGYINLLDAANAWQLVLELKQATGLCAAASFKHVSPAGAAVAVALTEMERKAFDVTETDLTPAAIAYVRARNADPMCSFVSFLCRHCLP
jgi:phosphoribosylaminoimidazolecarboxamide formyltransferase/IMP cyclohydrolase